MPGGTGPVVGVKAMSSEATELHTDSDPWDVAGALLIWEALRHRGVGQLAAAVLAAGIMVADAVRAAEGDN